MRPKTREENPGENKTQPIGNNCIVHNGSHRDGSHAGLHGFAGTCYHVCPGYEQPGANDAPTHHYINTPGTLGAAYTNDHVTAERS